MNKQINAEQFKEMIRYGCRYLEINRELINTLNVFPVPDGDTGTNMSMTFESALREVDDVQDVNMENISTAFARGALKGARGNSGVILSQIIKGICEVLREKDVFTSRDFSKALNRGTQIAYSAVAKPKEGTILTVIRVIAESSSKATVMLSNFTEFIARLLVRGEDILKKTEEMLPVLKKAGTVDAGGMGVVVIIRGFLAYLREEALPDFVDDAPSAEERVPLMMPEYEQLGEIEFGYCTEYFIINLKKKTTLVDIDKLRDKLMSIGDSVLAIGDLNMVKVHVHTNNPNVALTLALQMGEIDKIKIENMREQNRQLKRQQQKPREKKAVAMLSISNGSGIRDMSTGLGVNAVIDGGQTMNPSVDDILSGINEVYADSVIVFPNNKNIILAAEQAKELAECNVFIVPTVCIQQGLRAMMAYNPTLSAEDNYKNMLSSYSEIVCAEVTYAIKDTNMDGLDIHDGDIIGIGNKKILSGGTDKKAVLSDLLTKLDAKKYDAMTLYYGNGLSEQEVSDTVNELNAEFSNLEIMAVDGGQQHYFYLIALE